MPSALFLSVETSWVVWIACTGTEKTSGVEDRELTAADGCFADDFRGRDLYQRSGGGPMLGYSDARRGHEVAPAPRNGVALFGGQSPGPSSRPCSIS